MNSIKLIGFFIMTILVFVGGLTAYFSNEEDVESSSRSNSSISSNKDGRILEKSEIKNKVEKVEDEPSALFNDPAINQNWGLKKSDAARAWSVSKGSKDIVVAVIDTGIDEKHEDLVANLWINPGESGLDKNGKDKSENGIDDDGNGFVDDVHGWNFVSNNKDLTDNHGHGTHIAGIIGAEGGNGKGISGISPVVSLMVLKYFDPKVPSGDNLKNTIAAIKYAVKMGAKIINYSGGGLEYSQEEHDAVAEAERKGILFVAAAGNERSNSDQHHYYPADYKLKNIISVTAIDPGTEVLSSSNFGTETVDIAAPGQNILSSLPGNSYGYMTGTSQATAFVSGAAALVMSYRRNISCEDVKKYILSTGDANQQLIGKTKNYRKLNLYRALTSLDQGVGATGVIAVNTSGKDMQNQFVSDPNMKKRGTSNDTSEMAKFGKSLIDAMGKVSFPSKMGAKPAGVQDGQGNQEE